MKIYTKFLSILIFSLAFCFAFGQYHVQNISTGNGSGSNWDNAISYDNLINEINSKTNRGINIEIKLYKGGYSVNKMIDFSNFIGIVISGGYSWEIDPETDRWIEIQSGNANSSILNANSITKFFKFDNNRSVQLKDFTLQNANFNSTTEKGSAASFTNSPNSNFEISNLVIKNSNITYTNAFHFDNIENININFVEFNNNQSTSNSSTNGSALYISNSKKVEIKNTIFKNNQTYQNGAALFLKNSENVKIFEDAGNNTWSEKVYNFDQNISGQNGGAVYLENSKVELSAIYFINNTSRQNGGAIFISPNSQINYIDRTRFVQNKAEIGGAIYNESNYDLKILSSLFHKNTATNNGGGIYNKKDISVVNSTFVSNLNSAILHSDNSKNIIYNSIFYLDTAKSSNFKRDISPENNTNTANNDVINNIVEDYSTANNIIANPDFVDDNSDFYLKTTSPAFNTGSEELYVRIAGRATTDNSFDIDKRFRNFGNSVDMGAYELTYNIEEFFDTCPTMITPYDQEQNIELKPFITWNKIQKANQYKLTIQEDFVGNPIIKTNVLDNSTTNNGNIGFNEFVNDLKPNTWYNVTIHPENTFVGLFRETCPIFRFKTKNTPTIPICPIISYPINNETNVSLTPEIKWNKVAEANSYTITIGTTVNGHDILNNYNVGNVDTFRIQASLKHSTQYFITINAVNEVGSSQNCATTTFFTLIPPDPCEQVKLSLQISKRDVTVNVKNGEKPYQYRLDNGMWQTSNIFNDLAIGQHIIEIKTAEGCIKSTTLELPSFYNLITPNSDGKNDQVDFSFLTTKQNATLLIVDRFGKIIFKDQGENQFIWRGKQLNGMTLPTNTYWYFMEWKELNSEITNKLQGSILLKNK